MQTQQWQVLCAMNAVHSGETVQAETKVCRSVMEKNLTDVLSQRTRYYFAIVILVMLPSSGSLANLFYDNSLGKIFIDALFPLETIWGIHLPLLVAFHFCSGIGNKYT